MQHPWLVCRPDKPGYVQVALWRHLGLQRLDGDAPMSWRTSSLRLRLLDAMGGGGKAHDGGGALQWVVEMGVYDQKCTRSSRHGEVRSRSKRLTVSRLECQVRAAGANSFQGSFLL